MRKTGSIFLFLAALMTHAVGQYASQCELPSQQKGLCMPIHSCKSFKNLDSVGEVSKEHQSHCGNIQNVDHVCCAESDIQLNTVGLEILKNQTCGIYNGDMKAGIFAFPWMALLVYNDTNHPYKCDGSIISEQYVLTAAHCVVGDYMSDLLYVRLGEYNISSEIDCTAGGKVCAPPVEDIEIEDIIIPDNYVRFLDDIALIRLKRKVQFQDHIRPLCLPIYDNLRGKTTEEYLVAAWGLRKPTANELMISTVSHVPLPECQAIFQRYRLRINLTDSVFCARSTGSIDSCTEDSGSPVVYKEMYNGQPRFVQFGFAAFGSTLCGEDEENIPSAHTNVSYHMQWITDNIRL